MLVLFSQYSLYKNRRRDSVPHTLGSSTRDAFLNVCEESVDRQLNTGHCRQRLVNSGINRKGRGYLRGSNRRRRAPCSTPSRILRR
jgi:hypothetical protein